MIDLLILLLRPALLYLDRRTPWWKLHLALAAVAAYLVDLAICSTYWQDFAGPRQGTEKTISDTLERICSDPTHPLHAWCWQTALLINEQSPTKDHIKAVIVK